MYYRGNATWLIFSILTFDVSHTGNATWLTRHLEV